MPIRSTVRVLVLKFVNSANRVLRSANMSVNSASVPCVDSDSCNRLDSDLSPEGRQRSWRSRVRRRPVTSLARRDVPYSSRRLDQAILFSTVGRICRRHSAQDSENRTGGVDGWSSNQRVFVSISGDQLSDEPASRAAQAPARQALETTSTHHCRAWVTQFQHCFPTALERLSDIAPPRDRASYQMPPRKTV